MCGIAGIFLNKNKSDKMLIKQTLEKLCFEMKRRGPDSKGIWISKKNNIGIGHNRLSIIDLNKRSNQPMSSRDNNYIISFNGEIYNYLELKSYLMKRNVKFSTKSDTEVILKLYELKGSKMLGMLRGMFSIAIWDKKKEKLFLARDPYGIKPLYIGKFKNGYIFSSQVKPILNSNLIKTKIDYDGVLSFLLFGNVIEPNTCFKNIINLKSGHYCFISESLEIKFYAYSNIKKLFSSKIDKKFSNQKIKENIKVSIRESIEKHTTSDVPVAVMLSGGIDSSSLISHLIDLKKEFTAITIVFEEFIDTGMDELPFAKEMLKGKKIKHFIRKVTKDEFINDIDDILEAMDQPTIDGINTWYACKAASEKNLKVLLSGVGGDELFFGYPSFRQIPSLLKISNFIKKMPLGGLFLDIIGNNLRKKTKNQKWNYLNLFCSNIYTSYWLKRGILTPSEINKNFPFIKQFQNVEEKNFIKNFMKKKIGSVSKDYKLAVAQLENCFYLRNQLLRDSDWASMYHSIELRTPFVDFFLLNDLKFCIKFLSNYSNKLLLAESSKSKIPTSIIKRKKTGFNIPILPWMKDALEEDNKSFVDANNYNFVNFVIKNIYKKTNIPFVK